METLDNILEEAKKEYLEVTGIEVKDAIDVIDALCFIRNHSLDDKGNIIVEWNEQFNLRIKRG